jgi:drug/metabolite transporter (DMT)-like permease
MHGPEKNGVKSLSTALLTTLATTAFAANSLFCREALKTAAVDGASFTAIRLVSGAVMLWLLVRLLRSKKIPVSGKSGLPAFMLFIYAIFFSFAYLELSVATGALILIGAVQGTLMLAGLLSGERLLPLEWTGFLVACSGFVALIFPGLSVPSLSGSVFMAIAGVAWGIYTLQGRDAGDPVLNTATNFLFAAPLAVAVGLAMSSDMHIAPKGLLLAIASGALTSGCGYVIWYAALKGLTAMQASIAQLAVPVLAAAGGVIFLSEGITMRLMIAGTLILAGIGLGLSGLTQRRGRG